MGRNCGVGAKGLHMGEGLPVGAVKPVLQREWTVGCWAEGAPNMEPPCDLASTSVKWQRKPLGCGTACEG